MCKRTAENRPLAVLHWRTSSQWARAQGCPWSEATAAAQDGRLEVLQWIQEDLKNEDTDSVVKKS